MSKTTLGLEIIVRGPCALKRPAPAAFTPSCPPSSTTTYTRRAWRRLPRPPQVCSCLADRHVIKRDNTRIRMDLGAARRATRTCRVRLASDTMRSHAAAEAAAELTRPLFNRADSTGGSALHTSQQRR